ncbi:MAG: winged helix-turn-helix domain-containing protein, partial [Candidatus Bathyarchaeia archaeon]
MRRSKLEIYEAILSALAKRPLTVDSIAYRTSMDCTLLQQYLESLVRYGLVQERVGGKKRLYAIT